MLKKFSFLIPVEGFRQTLKRFPLSSACSLALLVIAFLFIHEVLDEDNELIGKFSVALGLGYFWFGAFKLYCESRGLSDLKYYAISLSVFSVLTAWIIYGEDWFSILMLVPVLFLMISYAPYLRVKDNLSVWFYNKQTWYGVSLSILAGLLWGGGISASLATVHVLFDVDINSKVYADLWSVALIVFAPLYALSWLPESFKFTREDCHAPQQLAFMLNWVLAPLMVIYTLILYAYFVKILGQAEFPRGHLTYMITSYAGIGVLTYMMGYPLREEGGAVFLKLFFKFFFPALIVPLGMMAVAIHMRIDQYGMTISRYYVVLAGLWLLILAVLFTFHQIRKKEVPLQIIPLLLSVFLFVTAFGPWDAREVSARDQFARLTNILIKTKILQDGKITKAQEGVTFEQREVISSTLEYLNDVDHEDMLKSMLPDKYKDDKNIYASNVMKNEMGLEYISKYDLRYNSGHNSEFFNYNFTGQSKGMSVREYDYLTGSRYLYFKDDGVIQNTTLDFHIEGNSRNILLSGSKENLKITLDNNIEMDFDLQTLSRDVLSKPDFNKAQPVYLEQEKSGSRVKVLFSSINGKRKDGAVEITNMSIRLLIATKH